MLVAKVLIGLMLVSSCLAMPEPDPQPKPEPGANFEMDMHFKALGGPGGDMEEEECGHDDPKAMCVMRQTYYGNCPSNMHFSPGSCPHPDKHICCKKNPTCGKVGQGQCYRTNGTTHECPLPLFRQSTRSGPCPDHEMSCCSAAGPDPHCHCNHWGYVGMCGERGWTGLCPEHCAGDKQSPINIENAEVKAFVDFTFTDYDKTFANIDCENNGHFPVCSFDTTTIKPKVSGGALVGDYIFDNMQFHIGCEDDEGSEHTVKDMRYSGELHLTHYHSKFDNLSMALHSNEAAAVAVFGIFLHVNNTQMPAVYDPFMKNLVQIVKRYEDATFKFGHTLNDLLPSTHNFYRYHGSLTHPSCNEVVVWSIFQEPTIIGKYQIRPFRCMMEGHGDQMCDNFRPVQALNGRKVTAYQN